MFEDLLDLLVSSMTVVVATSSWGGVTVLAVLVALEVETPSDFDSL
jgi:hypothetical protein